MFFILKFLLHFIMKSLFHIFSDLFTALKKLFGNPILIFHTLSIIFQINGFFGYLSFMPKYIENQFHRSASTANWYSGTSFFILLILPIIVALHVYIQCASGEQTIVHIICFQDSFSFFPFLKKRNLYIHKFQIANL